jgi:hypothetical protein
MPQEPIKPNKPAMNTFRNLLLAASLLAVGAFAYSTNSNSNSNSNSNTNTNAPTRRAFFQKAAITSAAVLLPVQTALAMEACPAGTANCIRTTWTPPQGTSKANMAAAVKAVLAEYPQEGQNGVDKGGWAIVDDTLDTGAGRVEYKSGIGNFAKFLNGGKPFIDDLKIEITDEAVELRSSSRIGESDLGVNQKRLVFLQNAIKAKGWAAPDPTY